MSEIGFAIKSIKETEFFVDESLPLDAQIDHVVNAGLEIRTNQNEINFIIFSRFKRKESDEDYLRGKTISTFVFQDLKSREIKKPDGKYAVDLPNPLWITLFSLSYSHARAMLARSAAGTSLSHLLLPIINPDEQFKKIFATELEGQP